MGLKSILLLALVGATAPMEHKHKAAALVAKTSPEKNYEKGMVSDGQKEYGYISPEHPGPAYQKEAFKKDFLSKEYVDSSHLEPSAAAGFVLAGLFLFAA